MGLVRVRVEGVRHGLGRGLSQSRLRTSPRGGAAAKGASESGKVASERRGWLKGLSVCVMMCVVVVLWVVCVVVKSEMTSLIWVKWRLNVGTGTRAAACSVQREADGNEDVVQRLTLRRMTTCFRLAGHASVSWRG